MTPPLHSPKEYLFNLHVTSSGEAKRLWRRHIKEEWDNECAYCGSAEISLQIILFLDQKVVQISLRTVSVHVIVVTRIAHTPVNNGIVLRVF